MLASECGLTADSLETTMPVIPVNRMMVLWKSDPNGRINELLVVDIDDKKPGLE